MPDRIIRVQAPAPTIVRVAADQQVNVTAPADKVTGVTRANAGERGPKGDQGAPGPKDVYLDNQPVQPGTTSWLRITRDIAGNVNGIYYGEA